MRGARALGPALALGSGAVFSISTVVGAAALNSGATAELVVAARLFMSTVLVGGLGLLLRGRQFERRLGRRRSVLLLGAGCITAVQNILLFAAVERLGSALAILLLYSYPPLVALIAVLLGRERLDRTTVAGLTLSLAGVALVVGKPSGSVTLTGCLLGLGAGLGLALYITAAAGLTPGVDPVRATALIQFGGLLFLIPVMAWRAPSIISGEAPPWGLFVGVAAGCGALMFIMAINHITPTLASVTSTIEPITTALLASVFLAENLTMRQFVGGVLTVTAVVTMSRRSARGGHEAEAIAPLNKAG